MYEKLHIDFLVSTSVNIGNEDCESLWKSVHLIYDQKLKDWSYFRFQILYYSSVY